MKKIIITIILIACGTTMFAQGTLPFLRLNTDARKVGMGNGTMGEATGMFLYSNPTSFFNDTTQTVYGSYSTRLVFPMKQQATFHAVSVGYKFGKQAVMVGYRRFAKVKIQRVSQQGDPLKPIYPNDNSVDIAVTRSLGHNLSAYVGGSFIHSYIGKTAYTGSGKMGVYYRNTFVFNKKQVLYNLGIDFSNWGGLVKYGKKKYSQPASIAIGGDIETKLADNHLLRCAITGQYFVLPVKHSEMTTSLGLDYELYNLVSLRAGYHLEKGYSQTTFGLGLKREKFNFNIGYQMSNQKSLFLGLNMIF